MGASGPSSPAVWPPPFPLGYEKVSRKESDFLRHRGGGAEQLGMISVFQNQDTRNGREKEKTTSGTFDP